MFALKTLFYRFYLKLLKIAVWIIPTKMPALFCGEDSRKQLARFISSSGNKHVLLVTDKALTDIGLYEDFVAELRSLEVDVSVFDSITPDPTDEQIIAGSEFFKQHKCDAVVGFGGGSSMDAAKLISILPIVNKPLEKMTGVLKIGERGAPMYLIPTTAGTGSEVTIAAVVTEKSSGQKLPAADPVLLPIAAALDANLMLGLPKSVTAATGFDALTHAIESYISTNNTDFSDGYAKTATKLIWENLQECVDNPANVKARESMAMASCYAGMAFSKAGLGYTHGIAHQFGAFYHVPHGVANSLALPHILRFSYPKAKGRLAELGRLVGYNGNDDDVATQFVDAVFALRKAVGLPETLDKLKESDYPVISKNALHESHWFYAVPRYMNQKQCIEILKAIAG